MRSTCLLAIVLAIVGVFGTWSTSGPVSLNGVEGSHNGWLVILFALMALCGVGSLARRGWLGVACVLEAGSIMLYTTVSDLLADRDNHLSSGWGIWLTIVMSAVLVAAAIVSAAQRLRGSTPAGARASSSSGS